MSWVPAAIQDGTSLFSWLFNRHAQNQATDAQQNAIGTAKDWIQTDRSNVISSNQGAVNDVRQNNSPASYVGKEALYTLQDMMRNPQTPEGMSQLTALTEGTNPADVSAEVLKDPAFKFNFDQALTGLKRVAAAPGGAGFRSGQFAKDVLKFGEDYTSNEYGKAAQRLRQNQQDRITNLTSLVGIDQKNINDRYAHLNDMVKTGQGADFNTNAATLNSQNNITDFTGRTGQELVDLTTAGGNVAAANKIAGANNTTAAVRNIADEVNQIYKLNQMRSNARTSGFNNGGDMLGV